MAEYAYGHSAHLHTDESCRHRKMFPEIAPFCEAPQGNMLPGLWRVTCFRFISCTNREYEIRAQLVGAPPECAQVDAEFAVINADAKVPASHVNPRHHSRVDCGSPCPACR